MYQKLLENNLHIFGHLNFEFEVTLWRAVINYYLLGIYLQFL